MKPFKGSLEHWWRCYDVWGMNIKDKYPNSLGYIICGKFVGHPDFDGQKGQTSVVVAYYPETNEVETLNSRYKLIGPSIERQT